MRNIARTLLAHLPLYILLVSAGCYDAGDKKACVGFKCPTGSQWPDGGNVTISHIWLPDGVSSVRTFHAYFVEERTPAIPETPGLPGQCVQLAEPEFSSRVETDVGPEVVITGEGDEQFVLPRYTPADCEPGSERPPPNGCKDGQYPLDFDYAPHDVVYLLSLNTNPQDGYFASRFTVEPAEPQPYSDLLTSQSYMLPAVSQIKPQFGVVPIQKGEPLEAEWEPRTPKDPDVFAMGTLLFVDPTLKPNGSLDFWPYLCVMPDQGKFTVPAEITDKFSPRGGIMQIGYAANEAVVTDDDRMINLFTTECQASLWMLVE